MGDLVTKSVSTRDIRKDHENPIERQTDRKPSILPGRPSIRYDAFDVRNIANDVERQTNHGSMAKLFAHIEALIIERIDPK